VFSDRNVVGLCLAHRGLPSCTERSKDSDVTWLKAVGGMGRKAKDDNFMFFRK
jgi:hypothetical protein